MAIIQSVVPNKDTVISWENSNGETTDCKSGVKEGQEERQTGGLEIGPRVVTCCSYP